jgi:hypothetical protein
VGARAVPAGGFATCSRAALGIDPAGTKTGLPGVWLSLAAERVQRPLRPAGNDPPKSEARPKAEGWRSRHTESRGGAPKGERAPLSTRGIRQMPPWLDAPLGAPLPSFLIRRVG